MRCVRERRTARIGAATDRRASNEAGLLAGFGLQHWVRSFASGLSDTY